MNFYLHTTLHQIYFTVTSIIKLYKYVEDDDFNYCPIEGKRSLGELCSHLSLICSADLKILQKASLDEMNEFYAKNETCTKEEWIIHLQQGYKKLEGFYQCLENLTEETSSYWGTTYSYFEWLLEMLAHLIHHRAQLHQYLVLLNKNVDVTLFE